jgi:membrane protein required for colicin V production
LAYGGYSGFKRGLILEIFSVAALLLAAAGRSLLLEEVLHFLAQFYQGQQEIVAYTVFVLLFVTIPNLIKKAGSINLRAY